MVITPKKMYSLACEWLKDNDIENAEFDASQLFEKAFGFKESSPKAEEMSDSSYFHELVTARSWGWPLQYLLGEWEFYGIPLKVGQGVLIPRQDTETLVETVICKNRNVDPVIIDLCSGSGCIALALEHELKAGDIYAVEKSEAAAQYLKENIALNNSEVKAVVGDCLDKGIIQSLPKADIIVCNPPYLTSEDMKNLQREVTYEPEEALFGGEDGLDFYRDITRSYKTRLCHNGMLAFEVGYTQAEEVMEILIQAGFEDVRAYEDYCGVKRVVIGFYTEKGNVKVY